MLEDIAQLQSTGNCTYIVVFVKSTTNAYNTRKQRKGLLPELQDSCQWLPCPLWMQTHWNLMRVERARLHHEAFFHAPKRNQIAKGGEVNHHDLRNSSLIEPIWQQVNIVNGHTNKKAKLKTNWTSVRFNYIASKVCDSHFHCSACCYHAHGMSFSRKNQFVCFCHLSLTGFIFVNIAVALTSSGHGCCKASRTKLHW